MAETVFFEGRFGKLSGTWTSPDGPGPFLTVLLCQGLSGVKHLVLPQVAEKLRSAGYAALAFDYAGFGESEGDGSWIDPGQRLMDAHCAFDYLLHRQDVSRIAVYGLSLGGGIALGLGVERSDLAAVVSVSGFASGVRLLRGMRNVADFVDVKRRLRADPTLMVDLSDIVPFPDSFRARYTALQSQATTVQSSSLPAPRQFRMASVHRIGAYDLDARLAKISPIPTLVQHGALDDVIAVEDALAIYRALQEPKELRIYADFDHIGLDTGPGFDLQVAATVAFLDRYLKPESPWYSG